VLLRLLQKSTTQGPIDSILSRMIMIMPSVVELGESASSRNTVLAIIDAGSTGNFMDLEWALRSV
jgi:hypothetical protein